MSAIRRLIGGPTAVGPAPTEVPAHPPRRGRTAGVADHADAAPARPDRAYHGPRGAMRRDWSTSGE